MKRNIAVKAWVKKPTDKALKKTIKMTMLELINELEKYEFTGGIFRSKAACEAWMELKKEVDKL